MSITGVVLVTGVMASGKSTVADLLARRLPRAAHVRGDTFRRMIVSGGVPPLPGDSEGAEQLHLRYRASASVSDQYADAGFVVIVQDIIIGPDLVDYVKLVKTRPLRVVVLVPRPDVVAAREAEREKTGYVHWTVAELDATLRNETARLGLWLDTSEQTPQRTVEEILDRHTEALV